MSEVTGTVFNIQRYSIDDGPGLRTTVFLKGCPLVCPWCSNPESQSMAPQLIHRSTTCKKCGACAAACPEKALTLTGGGIVVDREKCVLCGACVGECIADSLEIKGKTMTVDQVWKVIRRDEVYYETSGGGVTCSGGEILMQPEFTAAIFKKCREEGVHTCADTSGFGSEAAMKTVLEFADLVYFDLKHADSKRHEELMGGPLEPIIENLKLAVGSGVDIALRIPVIPGYNNSESEMEALADLARSIAPNAPVSMLPYHKYGESKYEAVGMKYRLSDLRENTEEELNRAKSIFESRGFEVKVSK
ncbi:MAG: glycyl-radical enzyme activating protein [Clostridiales bacterium]|nr:glycyl-radical enzyme activating protein [Clostridiales bacterium]